MASREPSKAQLSCHGANVPRGLDASDTGRGRFGRMFPCLPVRELSPPAFEQLMAYLRDRGIPNDGTIPTGYTYLAQFVDHDLTFDPSSLHQRIDDPHGRVNFRSPRLDLDSIYGSGPSDQPYLYDRYDDSGLGVKLLIDERVGDDGTRYHDLPRNAQCRALIGDPRNDEHLIIAQLHLLLLEFHNSVVDRVHRCEGLIGPELFREARRVVRWHYQWIVTHDFLRQIVGEGLAEQMMASSEERRCFRWDGEPFMPLEFSGAAYRFGHSMVRPSYFMNENTPDEIPILPFLGHEDLHGFRALPSGFVIDWRLFFELGAAPPALKGLPTPKLSARIDTVISRRLFVLPADVGTDGEPDLPLLNLQRAHALRLPAGPDVARAMGVPPLDPSQLELDGMLLTSGAPAFTADAAAELLDAAPLWYYVLCEAAALNEGMHLGPVGGRIVAEVLVGLLEADPGSYAQSPGWIPELKGETTGDFTMPDLIRFTHPKYATA